MENQNELDTKSNPPASPEIMGNDTWAKPVTRLNVGPTPAGAINLNVDGRRLTSPIQGFGQLWQRTFRVALGAAPLTPQQVVRLWKEKLPELMPASSRFYPSLSGVKPGEIVLINAELPVLIPGGVPVETGVMVLYADDLQFTVMTPEGHPEAGFNTFGAYEENGIVFAMIESLARTNDLIYEIGYKFFRFAEDHDQIWVQVLQNLAGQFGAAGPVVTEKVLLDPNIQWSKFGNLWQNAAVRSIIYIPVRLWNRLARKEKS